MLVYQLVGDISVMVKWFPTHVGFWGYMLDFSVVRMRVTRKLNLSRAKKKKYFLAK